VKNFQDRFKVLILHQSVTDRQTDGRTELSFQYREMNRTWLLDCNSRHLALMIVLEY